MRSLSSLARAAAVAAAAIAATPTLAHADPIDQSPATARSVRVHQSVLRSAGRCTYSARLLGAYTRAVAHAGDGTTPARDALVNIDTRLECRGTPPAIVRRQLYFAATDEATLLARVAGAARAEHPGRRSGQTCAFAPVLHTDATGTAVEVADVTWQCGSAPAAEPTATTTTSPSPSGPRHHARHSAARRTLAAAR